MLRKLVLVWCAALLVLPAACGKSKEERAAEKQIEKDTGGKADVKISKDKVEMKVKTDEGDFEIASGGGAKVPDSFPKDVLVYKGAAAIMAATQDDQIMLTLRSGDDAGKVLEAYKKSMTAKGWEEKASMTLPVGTSVQYEKGERQASITINSAEGQTHIQLVVQAEK